MSKKNLSVGKRTKSTKSSSQKVGLNTAEQQILLTQQLETQQAEQAKAKSADKVAAKPVEEQDEVLAQIDGAQADAQTVTAAVEQYVVSDSATYDQGGDSLLVADKAPAAKKEEDDDRKGGFLLSNNMTLPFFGLLAGGLAIAGSGGGDDGSTIRDGFVIEGPVETAIVFRDSDGDGKWLDKNANGIWEKGDEYITTTDATGHFTGLGGEGLIVSRGLQGLVAVDEFGVTSDYVSNPDALATDALTYTLGADAIRDSNGNIVVADALDAGVRFTGIFVAPGVAVETVKEGNVKTETVYVTGVSTLVALTIEAEHPGVLYVPTQQEIIDTANSIFNIISSDFAGSSVATTEDAVSFFQSSANQVLSAFLAVIAAKTENEGGDADAVQAAMLDAMSSLAEVVVAVGVTIDGTDDADNLYGDGLKLDLGNTEHLFDMFPDLNPFVADAMASMIESAANIDQTAGNGGSARPAIFVLNNNVTDPTRGPVGDITVLTADPDGEDSSLNLSADTVALSSSAILVHSSTGSTDANLDIPTATGSISSLTVLSSSVDSNATANIGISGDVTGDIRVMSSGDASNANADIHGMDSSDPSVDTSMVLHDSNILVSAGGESSDANLNLSNASGSIGNIIVTSPGYDADADADIGIDGEVNGDISVLASGDVSSSYADIHGQNSTDATMVLNDSNINVTASGNSASARLSLDNAAGNIGHEVASNDVVGMQSLSGGIVVQTLGSTDGASAIASIDINGTVNGDIIVNAGGVNSEAEADITLTGPFTYNYSVAADTSSDASLTLRGQGPNELLELGNRDLDLESVNVDSSVQLTLVNVNVDALGSLIAGASPDYSSSRIELVSSDVTLNGSQDVIARASGASSDATVLEINSLNSVNNVKALAEGDNSSATVIINDELSINQTIQIVASGEDSRGVIDANISGTAGPALASSTGEDAGSFLYINGSADIESVTVSASGDGSEGYAYLATSGNLGDITVEASGGNSYWNASASAEAEVTNANLVNSNITVTASGYNSRASADVYDVTGTIGHSVTEQDQIINQSLNGGITVQAMSNDSNANASVDIDGTINGDIVVKTEGNYSYANLSLDSDYSSDSTVELNGTSITITAAGYSSNANATVRNTAGEAGPASASATGDFSNVNLVVEGAADIESLTVTASGDGSEGYAYINTSGTLGDIVVEASGNSANWNVSSETNASAEAEVTNAVLTNSNITVTATGENASASADIYGVTGTIGHSVTEGEQIINQSLNGGITVQAMSNDSNANASVDIDGTINGDIVVKTDGLYSYANLSLDSDNSSDSTVVLNGTSITITAAANSSDANANVGHTAGEAGAASAIAAGDDSNANLRVTGSADIDSLTVTASGDGSEGYAYISTSGTLGDITVEASGNAGYWNTSAEAEVAFTTLNNSNITVTATGTDSSASADIYGATGTIGHSVTDPIINQSMNGGITVQAEGYNSNADARIFIDGTINGDIVVQTDGVDSYANLSMNTDGSLDVVVFNDTSITITAAGEASDANATVLRTAGNAGPASATAAGEDSRVDLTVEGAANIESLTVLASGDGAEGYAYINTSGNIGDITVEASGSGSFWNESASAEATVVNSNLADSNITVTASGDNSRASADVHANGTIGHEVASEDTIAYQSMNGGITAQTLASADDGLAFVSAEINATVNGDIVLRADGYSSSVEVHVNSFNNWSIDTDSVVTLNNSNISVTASGNYTDANLEMKHVTGSINYATVIADGAEGYSSLFVSGDVNVDNLTVIASGNGTDAEARLETSGNLGDITVLASGNNDAWVDASAEASIYGATLADSNITVTTTGSNAHASVDVFASGTVGHEVANEDIIGHQTINGGITAQTGMYASNSSAFVSADINATINGDIVAQADGYRSSVEVNVNDFSWDTNSSVILNNTTLIAKTTGGSSDANIDIARASGSLGGVVVEAGGSSSDANVSLSFSGDLTIGGDISIVASGEDSRASADLHANSIDGSIILNNVNLTIAATGDNSNAGIWLDGPTSGSLNNLTIRATGNNTFISQDLETISDINGDILVEAGRNSSYAELNMNTGYSAESTTVGSDAHHTNITLTSGGSNSSTEVTLLGMVGQVGEVAVNSTGSYTDADLYLELFGTLDAVSVDASGYYSSADVNISGDITVSNLDIAVKASGYKSVASVEISDVHGSIGAVNVEANGDMSSADLRINFDGDLSINESINVVANGVSADANASFNGGPSSDVTLNNIDLTLAANGNSSDASFSFNVGGSVSGSLHNLTVSANGKHTDAAMSLDTISAVNGDILVTASGYSADSLLTLDTPAGTLLGEDTNITVTASGILASADANIYQANGDIGNITVSGTNDGAEGYLALEFTGDINGDIILNVDGNEANSTSAYAEAYIYANTNTDRITMHGGVIQVNVAGFQASADLTVRELTGNVASISVTTGEDRYSAEAEVDLHISGDLQVNGDIYVATKSSNDYADVDIYLHDNNELTNDVLNVDGNVTVTATSEDAGSNLYIESNGNTLLNGTVNVTATAVDSNASLRLNSESAIAGDITLLADAIAADAKFRNNSGDVNIVLGTEVDSIQVGTNISITATGRDADAMMNLSTAYGTIANITAIASGADNSDAKLSMEFTGTITGDLHVETSGSLYSYDAEGAAASIDIVAVNGIGHVTLDGSGLSALSAGESADAKIYIGDVRGTITGFDVTASGVQSDANIKLVNDDTSVLTIVSDMNITASGMDSDSTTNISGDVAIEGDIIVLASGSSSEASVDINTNWSTFGVTTLGTETHSTNISVIASGYSSEAYADIKHGVGSIGTITVQATGDSSEAAVELMDFNGEIVGDINILASGDRKNPWWDQAVSAELNIDGSTGRSVTLGDGTTGINITAVASGGYAVVSNDVNDRSDSSIASFDINNAKGDINNITLTASGTSADAAGYLHFQGDVHGDLTFTSSARDTWVKFSTGASNEVSNDAVTYHGGDITLLSSGYSADIEVQMHDSLGTIGNITVTASGWSAEADLTVQLNGEMAEGADILVMSSNYDTSADVDLTATHDYNDPDDARWTMNGGDVTVIADGMSADADVRLWDADGTINSFTVGAYADGATASVDVNFSGTLTSNITVASTGNALPHYMSEETENRGEYGTQYGSVSVLNLFAGEHAVQSVDMYTGYSMVANNALSWTGRTVTLTIGATVLSYEFVSEPEGTPDYYTMLAAGLRQDAGYATSGVKIDNIGEQLVIAYDEVGEQAVALLAVEEVVYVAEGTFNGGGDSYNSSWSHPGSFGSEIVLDATQTHNFEVTAYGGSADAELNATRLVGTVDELTVYANGLSSDATANLHFNAGGVDVMHLDARLQTSTVTVAIEQTSVDGSVTVTGDGEVSLSYTDKTASTINLTGLHATNPALSFSGSSNDLHAEWGNFTLNIEGDDADVATNSTLVADMLTISAFDVNRDSINLQVPKTNILSDLEHTWMYPQYDNTWDYTGPGSYQASVFTDGGVLADTDALIAAAEAAFAADSFDSLSYYFATIGADGYLAYDYDGSGVSGLIKLEGVTQFNSLAVEDNFVQLVRPETETRDWTESYNYTEDTVISDLIVGNNVVVQYANIPATDINLEMKFDSARIGDVTIVGQNPYHYLEGDTASTNVYLNGSIAGDANMLHMNQSDIAVTAYGRSVANLALRDAEGDINSLTVETRYPIDETTQNNYDMADADVLIRSSDLVIDDISLYALNRDSDITVNISSNDAIYLDHSAISIVAGANKHTGYFTADYSAVNLNLVGATGVIEMLDVSAYSHGSLAQATLSVSADIETIQVRAIENWSDAVANINLHGDNNLGSILVQAGQHDASDEYFDSMLSNDVIDGWRGDTAQATVAISTGCSDADNSIIMTGGDIYVTARGDNSDARLYMSSVNNVTGSINAIVVSADDYSTYASAEFDNFNANINDRLYVGASNDYAEAVLTIAQGSALTGINFDSARIEVEASGDYTQADLHLQNSQATGYITEIIVDADGRGAYASANIVLDGTVGNIYVNAEGQWDNMDEASADLFLNSIVGQQIDLREGGIEVRIGAWASGDVVVHANNLNGTITSLDIFSENESRVSVEMFNMTGNIDEFKAWASNDSLIQVDLTLDGSVGTMIIHASEDSYVNADIDIINGGVGVLDVSGKDRYSSSTVDLTLTLHGANTVGTMYLESWASADNSWCYDTTLNVTIDLETHGGVVFVGDGAEGFWQAADDIINLTYSGGVADEIYIGYANLWEFENNYYNHQTDAFNLTLNNLPDVDTLDETTLLANALTLYGFDGSSGDTIQFDGITTNYQEASSTAASMGDFLTAADAALSGGGYYFSLVDGVDGGGDGWLAMDNDGSGITQLIHLDNATSLNDFAMAYIRNYNEIV